jgi:hypothetical protein
MPRVCTICSHEKRAEIESAVVANAPFRDIARQFGVSKDAVARHVSEHIHQTVQQSHAAMEEARGLDVVQQLKDINEVTLDILKRAKKEKKDGMSLLAIDRICKQIELQAKLLGAIDKPQVNVLVSPEWLSMRSLIVQALAPYPDARLAVALALSQMENTHVSLN